MKTIYQIYTEVDQFQVGPVQSSRNRSWDRDETKYSSGYFVDASVQFEVAKGRHFQMKQKNSSLLLIATEAKII